MKILKRIFSQCGLHLYTLPLPQGGLAINVNNSTKCEFSSYLVLEISLVKVFSVVVAISGVVYSQKRRS